MSKPSYANVVAKGENTNKKTGGNQGKGKSPKAQKNDFNRLVYELQQEAKSYQTPKHQSKSLKNGFNLMFLMFDDLCRYRVNLLRCCRVDCCITTLPLWCWCIWNKSSWKYFTICSINNYCCCSCLSYVWSISITSSS